MKLNKTPLTPMNEDEIRLQCSLVSEAALGDPGEQDEELVLRDYRFQNLSPEFYNCPD
jgi:hypothetical protein